MSGFLFCQLAGFCLFLNTNAVLWIGSDVVPVVHYETSLSEWEPSLGMNFVLQGICQ
jgi:hypothetical protein